MGYHERYVQPIVSPLFDIDIIYINIFNLLIKIYLSLIFIKYFINKYNICSINLNKNTLKRNYKVVIIIKFLLHQN